MEQLAKQREHVRPRVLCGTEPKIATAGA
jgi:hypothetical protein